VFVKTTEKGVLVRCLPFQKERVNRKTVPHLAAAHRDLNSAFDLPGMWRALVVAESRSELLNGRHLALTRCN
jgi:hypothetical protein